MPLPRMSSASYAFPACVGGLLVLLALAPLWASAYQLGELTLLYITAIASLGLTVLTGWAGFVSLAQSAFVGVGAYVYAGALAHGLSLLPALGLAIAAGAVSALVLGQLALRVSGPHAIIATMAFGELLGQIAARWTSVTGGHNGQSVPAAAIFGFDLGNTKVFYLLCLVVLVSTVWGLSNLRRNTLGRALVALRDGPLAAQAVGVAVHRTRLMAFMVAAGVAGLAGALWGHQMGYIVPESFGLHLSLQLLLIVQVGGGDSPRGALLGAILISALSPILSAIKPLLPSAWSSQFGLEAGAYGMLLLLCVRFMPDGLDGGWLALKRRLQQHMSPADAQA